MPTPDRPRWIKPAVIAGGTVATVLTGAAIVDAIRGGQTQTQVPATETPHAASATPKSTDEIKTPAGTFKVEVSPSSNPIKSPEIKAFECAIMDPNLCAQGELLSPDGKKYYIGWRNIAAGTPLSSFLDGERTTLPNVTATNSPFYGQTQLLINTTDSNTFGIFTGRIKLSDNPSVKNGQTVATMSEGGNKIWDDYVLVFTADEKSLKAMFPTIMGRTPRQVSLPSGSPTTIITPPNYYNKP